MKQLALSIPLRDHSDFANFYVSPENTELVAVVRSAADEHQGRTVLITGEAGSGRSHLLEAACLHASQQRTAVYLPLKDLKANAGPEVLQELESIDLLAIDDVDCIAGEAAWEEALFHCYNRSVEAQRTLIFSASSAPASIAFQLKDLRSRLSASLIYTLAALTDQHRAACLQQLASNLGLQISDEVASYILLRANRDTASLVTVVETLDRETLSAGRRPTIPFVKQTFGW